MPGPKVSKNVSYPNWKRDILNAHVKFINKSTRGEREFFRNVTSFVLCNEKRGFDYKYFSSL